MKITDPARATEQTMLHQRNRHKHALAREVNVLFIHIITLVPVGHSRAKKKIYVKPWHGQAKRKRQAATHRLAA